MLTLLKAITYPNKSQADSGCNLRPIKRKKTSAAEAALNPSGDSAPKNKC